MIEFKFTEQEIKAGVRVLAFYTFRTPQHYGRYVPEVDGYVYGSSATSNDDHRDHPLVFFPDLSEEPIQLRVSADMERVVAWLAAAKASLSGEAQS